MSIRSLYVIVTVLFLIKGGMRCYFTNTSKESIAPIRILLYIILSIVPLLALQIGQWYLPAFYLLYLLCCFLQEKVLPLSAGYIDQDIRVRFVIFGSIHLFSIGLAALLTKFSLGEVLDHPRQILNSMIFSALIMVILNLYTIFNKSKFGVLLRNVQKKEFQYLFYFLNLGVFYIFEQSILCLSKDELNVHLAFFLCGNLISLVLIFAYLHTLYKIQNVADKEQSNRELEQSLWQGKQQIQHLLTSIHFDTLTGARSRLFLIQESTRLLDYEIPFALVYIDLNGLKKINDRYGHKTGDQYLCQFSKMMQEQMRQEDTFARFGGDEFIVLFPGCNKDHAEKRIEKIQLEIQAGSQRFCFAAGCADTTEEQELDALIALADQRMYQRKEEGRAQKHA